MSAPKPKLEIGPNDPFWREATEINSEALHAWKDEHPAEWTEIKRITGRSTNS